MSSNDSVRLSFDVETGVLSNAGITFADRPYRYAISGTTAGNYKFYEETLVGIHHDKDEDKIISTGRFPQSGIKFSRVIRRFGSGLEESITLTNTGKDEVDFDDLGFGFAVSLTNRKGWNLCAIPFRVQLDGSVHDYSSEALASGNYHNATYIDSSRPEPELREDGILRSEAWAWYSADTGLAIIKYNNAQIELSVAKHIGNDELRFGGAGFSLYGEPSGATKLAAGESFTFGSTFYIPYEGEIREAYAVYRDFLDSRNHGFPRDYNPPVNWNELYDIGWYHSDKEKLKEHYTREALLREAQKARDCQCDLLYLDPGWEVVEGSTLWDEERLGLVEDLIKTLRDEYGLKLAYRTILRSYDDLWPHEMYVKHSDGTYHRPFMNGYFHEPCMCNSDYRKEKLRRILDISRHGVSFMMLDEMDWRGPCYDAAHGHKVPSTPLDHVEAVYALSDEIRKACPSLTTEVHDPVWPWSTAIYVPTYFRQGFGGLGSYDENWGFEYMWECLNDMKSGKALALYYYALGCNVPLYLHITMAADNDNCLFFWWVASTVRHLGIGGKESNPTVEPSELPDYDHNARFAAYTRSMEVYQKYKPYFARGKFSGIAENVHLHTLPDKPGGVVNVYNLTDEPSVIHFRISKSALNTVEPLSVSGAESFWDDDSVSFKIAVEPMSPRLVLIGGSCED